MRLRVAHSSLTNTQNQPIDDNMSSYQFGMTLWSYFFSFGICLICAKAFTPLTQSLCQQRDNSSLWSAAKSIADAADVLLVPSAFSRVVDGFLAVIVDEDDGENNGGSTNTDGSYATFFFKGSDIFPNGVCDIPQNSGKPRCGSSGEGMATTFMLGPADAIAFVGCSPPAGLRYFSYDVDIGTRLTEE